LPVTPKLYSIVEQNCEFILHSAVPLIPKEVVIITIIMRKIKISHFSLSKCVFLIYNSQNMVSKKMEIGSVFVLEHLCAFQIKLKAMCCWDISFGHCPLLG
jgi:hypothetical protein